MTKNKRKVVKKLNLNNIRIKYLTNILQDDDLETLLVLVKAILWTESNPDKYSEERAKNWKALRARSLENQTVLKKQMARHIKCLRQMELQSTTKKL